MESKEAEVSGGGSTTSIADLPSDWRRQMNDEMREALKALDAENNIKDDEFTNQDAVGIWRDSLSGTKRHLARLVEDGLVTVRTAYDPRSKNKVKAYKMV